jgi:hypothetical protein
MWARIHLIPALQAEEDRDQVRRYLADRAREKELLGTETRVYNNDRYVAERDECVSLPATDSAIGLCDLPSLSPPSTRPSRENVGDLGTERGSCVNTKAEETHGETCLHWLFHLGRRATIEFFHQRTFVGSLSHVHVVVRVCSVIALISGYGSYTRGNQSNIDTCVLTRPSIAMVLQ